jgi:hypothetical protein
VAVLSSEVGVIVGTVEASALFAKLADSALTLVAMALFCTGFVDCSLSSVSITTQAPHSDV